MSIYRDAGHCIARCMSIETNDGTAKSGWQMKYQSGFPEERGSGSGLSAEERLTQDAMTRHLLHRVPLVGVPRAVLDARRAWHRDRQPPQGAVFQGHGRLAGQDFFAFQARVVARDALP